MKAVLPLEQCCQNYYRSVTREINTVSKQQCCLRSTVNRGALLRQECCHKNKPCNQSSSAAREALPGNLVAKSIKAQKNLRPIRMKKNLEAKLQKLLWPLFDFFLQSCSINVFDGGRQLFDFLPNRVSV